jgi:TPR repeat protein
VWQKRDLGLCAQFVQKLNGRGGVADSVLFVNRAEHRSAAQLTKCGFIMTLIGDPEYAQTLFRRASDGGELTGTLMAGLALFHGMGIERETLKGCQFLAKCMIDPVALLHLGAATREPGWLDRAVVLLNGKRNELTKCYEFVGDLFFDGIKLPKDFRVASLWYGYAAIQAEIEGADNSGIIRKIELLP